MPTNTNPIPGVYVPPPPDIPAWSQAAHAPLAGPVKKFKYTRPIVHPDYQSQSPSYGANTQQQYPQSFQNTQQTFQQQQQQPQPYVQATPVESQAPYSQLSQVQPQQPFGQHQQFNQVPQASPSTYQYQQPDGWSGQQQAIQSGYVQPNQAPQHSDEPNPQATTQMWQPQQAGSHHETTNQVTEAQLSSAPTPVSSHASVSHVYDPVSPISHRQSMSFSQASAAQAIQPTDSPINRKSTISSVSKSTAGASALGFGGPSDWEHFGTNFDEEVDDTATFGAKSADRSSTPQQLDSVELPAQTPPRPASSVPTELSVSVAPPQPPSAIDRPASTVSAQLSSAPLPSLSEVPQAKEAPQPIQLQTLEAPPERPTPATTEGQRPQATAPSQPQTSFVVDDGGWAPTAPKAQEIVGLPQTQTEAQFIMDDGGIAPRIEAQKQVAEPKSQPQTAFLVNDGVWSASIEASGGTTGLATTPTVTSTSGPYPASDHADKEDGFKKREHELSEKEKELVQKSQDLETREISLTQRLQDLAIKEGIVSNKKQELTTREGDFVSRQQDLNNKSQDIEAKLREVEDKEQDLGIKDHELNIKSAELDQRELQVSKREQGLTSKENDLNTKNVELVAKELEVTKKAQTLKEMPATSSNPPQPSDLIPDLDPWYVGSLDRFLSMLRAESAASLVEDKIKVFTDFVAAESGARGIPYYREPPQKPPASAGDKSPPLKLQRINTSPLPNDDAYVMVEQMLEQYSPGGRPILPRRGTSGVSGDPSINTRASSQSRPGTAGSASKQQTIPESSAPAQTTDPVASSVAYKPYRHSISMSDQSAQSAILTPTSLTEADNHKITPVPETKPEKSAYKPFSREGNTVTSPIVPAGSNPNRQSVLFAGKREQDEIFIEQQQAVKKPDTTSRPGSISHPSVSSVQSFVPHPSLSPLPPAASVALVKLQEVLPIKGYRSNERHERLSATELAVRNDYPIELSWIASLHAEFEKAASSARSANEAARRKRQEESEANTDALFNEHEIAYADIADIENEFKAKEAERKGNEDQEEYERYVKDVFEKIYGRLQGEIGELMEMWVQVEGLVQASVSGKRQVLPTGSKEADSLPPTTLEALRVLQTLHPAIEARHEAVATAVAERDRRYKKTQVAPLYAAGKIPKMKSLERHFDLAEKNAALKTREEKVTRMPRVISTFEDAIVKAVGDDQTYRAEILDAVEAAVRTESPQQETNDDNDKAKQDALNVAEKVLRQLSANSIALMKILGNIDKEVCNAVFDIEVAQARVKPDTTPADIQHIVKSIEDTRNREMAKVDAEAQRRLDMLEEDERTVDVLFPSPASAAGAGATMESGAEKEKEKEERMRRALEEAKRRNAAKMPDVGDL